jgi:adenylate cyclase
MSVFVSYARPDEARADRVAEALRSAGYEVWRDDELPAHRAYAEVIEEHLNAAKAVVVLWSIHSAKSQWVRAEADSARNRQLLVQASLDGTIPPMPFNQIQCADLNGSGNPTKNHGWSKLVRSLQELAGDAQERTPTPHRQQEVAICVLPFSNMSGDPEQEYFSDGVSEDITTDLSKVSALAVTARNTAFQFKGKAVDVCEVARRLGVSHVLEGSVRTAGGRVRITAQLIDGSSGDHIWAERYDRDLTDIFELQDELSKAIVDALKIKLLAEEKQAIERRGTTNADAYNAYLLARKYWITGNWGDVRQLHLVERVCKRAIELDSNYARAWGLLAIIQCILHFTFTASDDDGIAAADRALSIDPNIAEAYCVRARRHYEHGEAAQADQDLAEALTREPDSWEVNREAARIYYFERRFSDAIRCYERAVALAESDYHSWGMLASAYAAVGDRIGAIRSARNALELSERVVAVDPTNGAAWGMAVYGLALMGDRDRVREWVDRALLVSPDNLFMRYNFACVVASEFKDIETALDLLEPFYDCLTPSSLRVTEADPDLDSVRSHPRYKEGIRRASERLRTEDRAPATRD